MKSEEHQSTSGSTLGSAPIAATPLSTHPPESNVTSGIKPEDIISQVSIKEQELKLKFSEEVHQYVREYIRLADQKAIFFFAGSTTLLAYLHKSGTTCTWIVNPKLWSLTNVLAFVATIGLALSALACLSTVLPRLNGSRRGIIFFAAICEYESSQDYVTDITRKTSNDLFEAKLKHTYDLSEVCKNKYEMLKWGQWIGAVAVIASLILLIMM